MKLETEYTIMRLKSSHDLARIQARGRLAERVYGLAWLTVLLVIGWLILGAL